MRCRSFPPDQVEHPLCAHTTTRQISSAASYNMLPRFGATSLRNPFFAREHNGRGSQVRIPPTTTHEIKYWRRTTVLIIAAQQRHTHARTRSAFIHHSSCTRLPCCHVQLQTIINHTNYYSCVSRYNELSCRMVPS